MIKRQMLTAVTTKSSFSERVFKKLPHLSYAVADGLKTRNGLKSKVLAAVPVIRSAKIEEHTYKQSRYAHVPEWPMRAVAYGPSGS